MDLSAIAGFFEQSVPIGVVAILIFQAIMSRDIKHINEKLGNHITDTNKKIDGLGDHIDKQSDRIDKLSDRLDRQGDRFNKLYDFLMQEKKRQ